jgi:ketosteroid isomerase-like protein
MTALSLSIVFMLIFLAGSFESALAQDRKQKDPSMRVYLENDYVRVQEHRLKPGQSVETHSHPCYFLYVMNDATVRFTFPDGSTRVATAKPDTAYWHDPGSHAVENIGDTEVRNIVTEVKNCGDTASDAIALQEVVDDIVDAYNSQDIDRLARNLHPEVGYMVPSRPYVAGWEAVRSMYERTFLNFQEAGSCGYLRATTEEMVIVGDWAWVRGESQFVRAECGSTPQIPADLLPGSKHLGVYKKEDGRWLRYRQMRNGNTPDMNI